MHIKQPKSEPCLYDAELPNASDVLISLCCVATQYASEPSIELAALGFDLAQSLNAPEYAQSERMVVVARQLKGQWYALLQAHQAFEMLNHDTEYAPQSFTMQ